MSALITAAQIRERFLSFFAQRGHQVVPSSPLVPAGDPTLLFTNAGMVQFKDVFLGLESRPYRRAVTVQKCMRAGGKHNDLDQVGKTARHQTFFEMLGNFSFGDYFKAEAIAYAWEFLTREMAIAPQRLWFTVHHSDEEARRLWKQVAGVGDDRVIGLGDADNFWAMGDTGPCGPCSEIYVDRGAQFACGPNCGLGQCECDRFEEIWNLVFMQYDRLPDGRLEPLPRPSIDTGMGLERLAAYLEGVESNFDTDLLAPLVAEVERLSGRPYDRGEAGMPFRVIADHVRALTFLLAEGVSFSNSGRGYVMRRILRRADRFGRLLGLERPFLADLVPVVVGIMGEAYPELGEHQAAIGTALTREEERFMATLGQGLKVLEERLAALPPGQPLPGTVAFELYDTYGFPLDLTVDAAAERGVTVEREGFERAMAEQRDKARAHRERTAFRLPSPGRSEFQGYHRLRTVSRVGALYVGDDPVRRLEAGEEGLVWLPQTPFYPEGGGQVGDRGRLQGPHGVFAVQDTRRAGDAIWHVGMMESGWLELGDAVEAEVEAQARYGAMRNHTGTHLLHAALRQVLGPAARQTGSLVAPDRLRFDFSWDRPLTEEQIAAVEDLVNRWILADLPVETTEKAREEALQGGALAFFGEKYGDRVRVVEVPGASQELCGGTHCQRTGQIGSFYIVEETGVGAGMRRVEAVTGWNAVAWVRERQRQWRALAEALKAPVTELPTRVRRLAQAHDRLEKETAALRDRLARLEMQGWLQRADLIGGYRVLVTAVAAAGMDGLRRRLDEVKGRVDGAVLWAVDGDRVWIVSYSSPRLQAEGILAVDVIRRLAPLVGGGGGGRAETAQAGGKARLDAAGAERIRDEALKAFRERLVAAR